MTVNLKQKNDCYSQVLFGVIYSGNGNVSSRDSEGHENIIVMSYDIQTYSFITIFCLRDKR